jgi:hypothetical protein
MRGIIVIGLAAVLLVGCGGSTTPATPTADPGRLLTLAGGTKYTESHFRMDVRVALTDGDGEALCRSLKGLSDAEAIVLVGAVQADQAGAVMKDATPTADQERAGAIFKEECARILEGSP